MSLKIVKQPLSDGVRPVRLWLWSIQGRLTLLYTLSAFGMLLLATGFLQWVLASNLQHEDTQFLTDKIQELRAVLKDRPNDPKALEQEVEWEEGTLRFSPYYVRLLNASGLPLLETYRMDAVADAHFPAPSEPEGAAHEVKWRSPGGRSYLLMSAWAGTNGLGKRQIIQVALDVSHDDALIMDYRQKLAIVLLLGIACSAIIGVAATAQGLKPLEEITEAVKGITAKQLHERVGPSRWPKELTTLAVAFDEMLDRLEDSFTRLSQFSADLAHELRTPLNNLMGEAEVILSKTRSPQDYEHVIESSLEEYARLSRMIDGLLFLARAEGAEAQVVLARLDARKEVETVRDFYEAISEEQRVAVSCEGVATIYADSLLFRQVVSNLLSNALQHTSSGGRISICIEQLEDSSAQVCIADTGKGIAAEHLPKIFDRFYRVDRARSQSGQGTGLGLAIVKSIMEMHSGRVDLQSTPESGTSAILWFPRPLPAPSIPAYETASPPVK